MEYIKFFFESLKTKNTIEQSLVIARHKSSDFDTEYPSFLFGLIKTERKGYPPKKRIESNLHILLHEILQKNNSITIEQSTESLNLSSNPLGTQYNTPRTHDIKVQTPHIGYFSNHYESLLSLLVLQITNLVLLSHETQVTFNVVLQFKGSLP